MKIENYNVTAQSQRSYQKVEHQSLTASVWGGGGQISIAEENSDAVSLSETAKDLMGQLQEQNEKQAAKLASASASAVGAKTPTPMSKEELKLQMLEQFLTRLTGRRVSLRLQEMVNPQAQRNSIRWREGGIPAQNRGMAGAGGELSATSFTYEREQMSYQAKGVINTADGKSISVDVSLMMSRQYMEYSETTLKFGADRPNLVDPLVINYGGTAASLTGEKYAFDLDADGVLDNISFAGPGSGFLALDKNGDGKINDGSELFGPNTGNGFDELRRYDSDGNGWIDENDDIFSKLRIWSKDADGNDQLFTLLELDVGAIYLGDISTEFAMTDAANNTQGVMRSTSFFLKESGGAGTMHHIDLSV